MAGFRGIDPLTRSILQLIEFLNEEFSILWRLAENRNPAVASRGQRIQRDQIKIRRSGICAMKRHAVVLDLEPVDQLHRRLREERVRVLHCSQDESVRYLRDQNHIAEQNQVGRLLHLPAHLNAAFHG